MLQITKPLSSVVRIQKARTTLLLDHPFFGTLLFRLGAQARSSIATTATDGVSLYFNPQFVETLSAAEIAGTLAHEVMHPALQHHTRRGGRNPRRWNMACDYAINPMLLDAGLTLPKDVLLDNRFLGMSAERIYNLLEEEEQNQSSSTDAESESQDDSADGDGGSNSSESSSSEEEMAEPRTPQTPGGIGQVLDAPEPENEAEDTLAEQARDWQIAVEQAENVAKLAGKLPAGVTRSRRLPNQLEWIGGSCCAAPARRPFRLTTAGPVPTAAMCGTVSTC
jgi:predicted metal-dependent peptidase